jgi:predicted Zn-dependent protease
MDIAPFGDEQAMTVAAIVKKNHGRIVTNESEVSNQHLTTSNIIARCIVSHCMASATIGDSASIREGSFSIRLQT